MSYNYAGFAQPQRHSVSQPIPGKTMIQNSTSGYVFELEKWSRLSRFLIIGSETPTYYSSAQKLTAENAHNVISCIQEDGVRAVNEIRTVSVQGRAPKNDAAIFALALAVTYGDAETKAFAYNSIQLVCRTGTHLFNFTETVNNMRGWSKGLCKGVSKFYTNLDDDKLALQLIKYRQRNGWTHKDVLRLSHARSKKESVNNMFAWAVGKAEAKNNKIQAYELLAAKTLDKSITCAQAVNLITEYRLPWEAIPTDLLKYTEIWEAMLPSMGMTAMVRNLGKMSNIGLLTSHSEAGRFVANKLKDPEAVKQSKLHPMSILVGGRTYAQGRGDKGSLTWNPVSKIIDSLDEAFYLGFGNVTPTGKNMILGIDVSASMTWHNIAGLPLKPAEAAAVMALVTKSVEENAEIVGFGNQAIPLNISNKMRLDDVLKAMRNLNFGSTNPGLLFDHARKHLPKTEVFGVYTDNEVNQGSHPASLLKAYRQSNVKDAKMYVVGMESNGFTIADPSDPGMLDVVGFDTAAPEVISQFMQGNI